MDLEASHYIVVKSPYAEQLCEGVKTKEYRTFAVGKMLENRNIAIAVARTPKSKFAGKIIGVVKFGEFDFRDESVEVLAYGKLDTPIDCRGGLGVKPIFI